MALRGSFENEFTSGHSLQIDWSATQNATTKQSTITAILYWISSTEWHDVNSTAQKTCSLTIDGTETTRTAANMADLNPYQKKEIHRQTKTVTHDSLGRKSVNLSAWFDCEVTLSGKYFGRVTVSGTAVLNSFAVNEANVWNGSSWVKTSNIKVWNGTAWVAAKKVYTWDEGQWKS